MSDLMLKIWLLAVLIGAGVVQAFHQWREDIWKSDLDSRYCCDGRECGCQGVTIREVYGHA